MQFKVNNEIYDVVIIRKRTTRNTYIRVKEDMKIYVTTNTEFLLKADNVVVMNNFKSIMNSNVQSVLNGNSILPYIGLKLPFIVDLSQNLILYDLIDKVMTDDGKLVSKLWK